VTTLLEQFEKHSLKESLEELVTVQDGPKLKMTLLEVIKDVERGILFSKALAKHPRVFDPIFVGLIAVGEKTGCLSFVLQRLVHHLKWLDDVQTQIFKAFRYPLFMIVFLGGAVVILMTVLVPELLAFMQSFRRFPFNSISVSVFFSLISFFCWVEGGSSSCPSVFKFHLWKCLEEGFDGPCNQPWRDLPSFSGHDWGIDTRRSRISLEGDSFSLQGGDVCQRRNFLSSSLEGRNLSSWLFR
jgi:hypothetical protein